MGLFNRNNPDRDRGYWGGSPEYGGHRDLGDRAMGAARRGWNRVENGVRDAFDAGGYDRDYGDRGFTGRHRGVVDGGLGGRGFGVGGNRSGWMSGGMSRSDYDDDFAGRDLGYRGTEPAWGAAWGGGYDRDFSARRGMDVGRTDFGRGLNTGGMEYTDRSDRGLDYGRRMHGAGMERTWEGRGYDDMDYDRGMRSRAQVDAGDPFGDRQSRTPIRVMRGGARNWGDRGDWNRGGDTFRAGSGDMHYDRDYRGWNQGVGDEPYYNTQDFRGSYDREPRGRDRDWF